MRKIERGGGGRGVGERPLAQRAVGEEVWSWPFGPTDVRGDPDEELRYGGVVQRVVVEGVGECRKDFVRGMLLICSGERCRVNGKKCRAMPADKSVTKDRFGDFGFSYEPRFWLWGDDFGRRSLAMVVVEGQFSMFQNCSSWLSELCGKSSRSSHPFVDNLNR